MLMVPMLVKAPVVTYTEIAKSPQWKEIEFVVGYP